MSGIEPDSGTYSYHRESYDRLAERWAIPAILVALLLLAGMTGLLPETPEEDLGEMAYLVAANQMHVRSAVGGLIDIEDAWAIEDERREAGEPLVRVMYNGDSALGYDAASDTFYCTLGVENGDVWPELALSVQDAPGVTVQWIDDFAYDYCADAIREGYRYELMAYTDEEYAYFGIVFTGLPIVVWKSWEGGIPIWDTFIPGFASVSSAESQSLDSAAMIHLRGGGAVKQVDKPSYRLEFHTMSRKGKDKKRDVDLLGMGVDSDWLLLSVASDETTVRNKLCWDMWKMWNEGETVPCMIDSQMIELFVNDEYMGLYHMMPPIRPETELKRIGGNPQTDCAFRAVRNVRGRTHWGFGCGATIEVRYKPDSVSDDRALELLQEYSSMNDIGLTDDEFVELVNKRVDVEKLMSYYAYFQVCGLGDDNIYNNMYIWMLEKDGQYRLQLSPWDMDMSMYTSADPLDSDTINLSQKMPRRMLDLNVNQSREILWSIWNEKKKTVLTEDVFYDWIKGTEAYINASGAYLRESEKWYGEAQELQLSEIYEGALRHINAVEQHMKELWPVNQE